MILFNKKIRTMSKEPFIITRSVNAPQALVWEVYTKPEHLTHWWGPKGLKMKHATVDLRPGGMFLYGMESPDGTEMWGRFVYREIDPISKLTFVVSFSDKDGGITRHPMAPTWPAEMLNITEFSEENGKTTIRMTGYPINCTDEEAQIYYDNFASMNQGFNGTFEQLQAYLAQLSERKS
jgi:uncharacterized protein YndB with AHSA1/START domain